MISILNEGFRIFKRSISVRKKGFKVYEGDTENICKQIINECYDKNKNYFMTSTGHFREFYTRDFGWCTESLINLGYKKEVKKTLEYALSKFQSQRRIGTTITPTGKVLNIYRYAPDSLAYITNSLKLLGDKKLISKYKKFLELEIQKFKQTVLNEKTGLVKNKFFSSIKDQSIRQSSCYDNIMLALVSKNAKELGLKNPLENYDFKKIITKNFWTGEYFLDDLSGSKIVSGDANIFPFWTKIFDSQKMLDSCIKKIKEQKLDLPFPLKYTAKKYKNQKYNLIAKIFSPNYETNSLWMHLGLIYLTIHQTKNQQPRPKGRGMLVHKKEFATTNSRSLSIFKEGVFFFSNNKQIKNYLKIYDDLIFKNKNFLEVFDKKGNPYKTSFYCCDEGMLWSAIFLDLFKYYF
ncbi:MAG: hypothetical protein ABIC91_03815 [Nanoarchaeota archaeon]|nr:hypothetical protein [Nanoarchaeota archaeon]MBU1030441.1 hypothetical protein [Nanoarchaeota archaeon]MBU1849776.1 hypothetical protein [Nanoarchaeota archaeon]